MKKLLATTLSVAMVASLASTAFAVDSTTITGDNDTKNPILNYQIPIELTFYTDPFIKGGDSNSQIFSVDFPIINKSDVPISAKISSKMVAGKNAGAFAGVTVAADPTTIKQDDATVTTKDIYLEAVAAKTVKTKEDAAAGTAIAHARPTMGGTVTTQPVFTNGTAGTTAAKFVIDFSGMSATGATSGDKYTFKITDADGKELGRATSAGISKTTIAEGDFATAFATTPTFTIKIDGKNVTFKASAASTNVVTFTDEDAAKPAYKTGAGTTVTDVLKAGNLKLVLTEEIPADAKVSLDTTVSNVPTYPNYGVKSDNTTPAIGSDTTAKVAVTKEAPTTSLSFILGAATYQNAYADDTTPTVFKAMAATDKGVSAFRYRGTVNPNAAWAAGDFAISATFDIGAISTSAYAKFTSSTDAQNYATSASAPSVNGGNLTPSVANKVGTTIVLPYSLGLGTPAATGITKVEHCITGTGAFTAATSALYDITTPGSLVLNTELAKALKAGSKIKVTFNDTAATVVTLTFAA